MESIVDEFLFNVKNKIQRSNVDFLIRSGFSLKNIQSALDDHNDPLKNSRYWTTGPIQTKSFNDYIYFTIRDSILKRVINNGPTDSLWHFNRFLYIISFYFFITEAVDEDGVDEGNIDFDEEMTMSDEEFIDDSEIEENITDLYGFTNVSRDYTEAVEDSFSDFDQEPNNYCNENEINDLPIDNVKDYFTKTLINPQGLNNKDSFFIRFYLL